MNEQQKKNYFSLNNDLEYMSPYSSNIKPDSYLTMSDAIKEYTINLDTSKNIMQGIEPEEAGVLGKIGQGVKNWFSNITDLPSNVADSITTSLNGYTSPNMTEEEANILLESVARGQKAKNELKAKEAYWTGTQGSVITGLTESAVDMVGLALLNTFSGGLGSAYMGTRTFSDITEKFSQDYLNKHGSMEGYEGGKNSAIALAHAGFSAWIEKNLGAERLWNGATDKFTQGSGVKWLDWLGKVSGRITKTAIGEGAEEFIQAESEYAAGLLADAEDRSFMEGLKDAAIQGAYGALLGGAFGTGTYYFQRNKISSRLQEMYGLDNQSATTIADSLINEPKNEAIKEMNIQNQLTEHYGDSYTQLVDKIKTSLINAGWETKNPDKDINQYARLSANNIGLEIMRQANLLNMTTTDYFDISQIEVVDNIVLLNKQNYQDPAIVKQQITDKKAELKELNKQVGIDNKARKDVLRQQIKTLQYIQDKMGYNEAILKDKQQNEIVNYLGETSTIKTEIDNAFKDATALRSNKLDTSNMIDPATVITRRTNAVMANILKNKTLYQSLVLEDRIPVAKRNIIANIPDIVSIGKKTDLNKELQQALTKLPNISKENFSMSVGNDTNVNALLYAFTFGSDVQIQEFLENYIDKLSRKENKKNISFTKRDIALQTLQESSITDGLIKDGVITDKDLKSVFMNTNDIDNTVEKILFQEEVGTYSPDTGNIYYQSVYAKVTDISTKSDIKEIRSDATQYLKDIVRKQDISHPTLGKIRVSNKGIKEFINESANPHKLALVPHLKELIETSTIGKEEAPRHPRKDNIVSFIPLYNDAIIDNKAYNTKIWIGKDNAGNLFYDVKLQEESTETGGTKNKSVVSSDTLNISITEKDTNVNNNIEDTILNQNANGFFDSELKAIVLGSNFNMGTLPHEMAHFFLDKNFKIWKRGDAPAKFMKDFNAIANILGISPEQESLTRDQQEMYASMTEAYLFGKGIAQGTEATLKSYWDWCPPQYNNILDIGFRDSEGKIQNPVLNKEAMEYFNNMYSQLALIDSPYSQSLSNPTTNEGDKLPSDKEERIERKNNINDNMTQSLKDIMQPDTPSEAIARTKAQNSFIDPMDSYIDEVSSRKEKEKNISFTEKIQQVLPGRGRNTREQMELSAQKYIEKNKEHALEVAFGSPVDDLSMTSDFVYNDTGIERAVLIREVMKLYSENSTEWSMLYHNFAIYRSEQGKAAGLTNDINTQLYMSGYARLVNLMETKAAAIRYGKGNDSVDRFNADVDKFVASWIDTILNTEPESKERDVAINNFLNSAKQEFGTDEAIQLLQEDISRMKRASKGQKKSFEDIARRKVKQLANAIPSNMDINQLMLLAREAQMQLKNIDSNNVDEAIAAGKAIRNFQEYIAEKGLDDSFFQKLIGAYAPRAMLSRPSTHLANIVSNSVEMYTVKSGLRLHYGKNIVSKNLIKAESERLSEIYKNTGFNLAQQYTINDKALLHGEEYRTKPATEVKGIGKLDPLKLLGDSDFIFRRELYLDALASICSKKAKGDVAKANELFNEYKQLGTLNEDALKARKEALLVANIGVFTQNGTFARVLTQIRNSLDIINIDYQQGKFAFGVKGGKGLGTLLAPFIKTPANIIELGARAIASPISSLVALKNNTYNIQHTIDLANLSMSLLIFGIVSALGGEYTGEKNKYNPLEDTLSFGDISIKLDLLGPIAQPLRQIYSAIDGEINTGLGQLPIYTEVRDLETARTSPIKFANSFMAEQVGKLIPSILKPSLQATGQQTDIRITDKWIKPYARNIGIVESRTAPDDYIEALVKTFLGSKVQIKDL